MTTPEITLGYLAPLAGIFSILSLLVVALRAKNDIPYGDGGNDHLLHAIRAHGNFAEWVPLTVMLIAGLEALGSSATLVHALLATLLVARVLHPIGLLSRVGTPSYFVGRIAGALSTWAVLSLSAILLALRV